MNRFENILLPVILFCLPLHSAADEAGSRAVIGVNPDLTAGEDALRAGDYEEGVRLTLRGLPFASSKRQRAAALSNICAGYSSLAQYELALLYCNRSIELNPVAWKTLQSRARALVGAGRLDDAIRDAEAGLVIAPQASALQKVLALARRLQQQPRDVVDRSPQDLT